MTAYISLYKKARKIITDKLITLENFKDDKFFFKVKDYDVTLFPHKQDRLWIREWTCSCTSYALQQDKIRCVHVLAAETYLVITNGKKEN